jgi:hypothetical protein
MTGLFPALAEVVPGALFDPAAVALMLTPRGPAPLGALEQGLHHHGQGLLRRAAEFAELGAFVDATEVGAGSRRPRPHRLDRRLRVCRRASSSSTTPPRSAWKAPPVGMQGIRVDPFAAPRLSIEYARSSASRPDRHPPTVYPPSAMAE